MGCSAELWAPTPQEMVAVLPMVWKSREEHSPILGSSALIFMGLESCEVEQKVFFSLMALYRVQCRIMGSNPSGGGGYLC